MKINIDPEKSRSQGWYMKGWEKEDHFVNGRRKTDWVYHGVYYDLPDDAPRLQLKVQAAVTTLLLIAVFLFISLSPTEAVSVPYVGYIFIFNAPVLLYYGISVFWYCVSRAPMTYRRFHASAERMKASSLIGMVLSGICVITDLIYLLTHISTLVLTWDLLYFAGVVICTLQYAWGWRILKQYPIQPID